MIGRIGIQLTLLTALFVGLYFGLRAIPASTCTFLHYDQTQVTANGIEYCATGASSFINVSRLPFPVTVTLEADKPLVAGQKTHYTLTLATDKGTVLRPSELAFTHTQKLHLLLVDPSREDYQHIHPASEDDAGKWTFDFTPRAGGAYKAYAEFVPSVTRRQVVGDTELVAEGKPLTGITRGLAAFVEDGYIYQLQMADKISRTSTDIPMKLTVKRSDGGEVKLEPIMGALAHLVAFDAGRQGYAHLHPAASEKEKDARQPELAFVFNTTEPGRYRVWGQVKIDGREHFAPFDIEVKD